MESRRQKIQQKRHDRDWLNPEDETEEWVEDNSHISNFIMQEDECRDE